MYFLELGVTSATTSARMWPREFFRVHHQRVGALDHPDAAILRIHDDDEPEGGCWFRFSSGVGSIWGWVNAGNSRAGPPPDFVLFSPPESDIFSSHSIIYTHTHTHTHTPFGTFIPCNVFLSSLFFFLLRSLALGMKFFSVMLFKRPGDEHVLYFEI